LFLELYLVFELHFERITYSQILQELNDEGEKLEFRDDLLDSHLRIVGKKQPGFFFITDWPMKLKPFQTKNL